MTTTEKNAEIARWMGYANGKPLTNELLSKMYSTWDEVMGVVKKIDDIGYNVHISRISCKITPILEYENTISHIVCGDTAKKIETIHEAVYQFVVWYNKNKDNEGKMY